MIQIAIREKTAHETGWQATISFDRGPEYPVTVQNPFTLEAEKELGWYFEEWLSFPFTNHVRASRAAASVTAYGEKLFHQLFRANPDVLAEYKGLVVYGGGFGDLAFEIRGDLAFHALHWEALKDPGHGRPFAIECPFIRQNNTPPNTHARWRPFPTLNVLLVTARPGGRQDVGYRTISRPLVESLHNSKLRAQIDIVRPGTYKALSAHLEETRDKQGSGYYHIIHFDLHGGLQTYEQYTSAEPPPSNHHLYGGYAQRDIAAYEGQKAFLLFEGEKERQPDLVSDEDLAKLLQAHQIPVAVLNACQSGKQVGDAETSLGHRLMIAGVQQVIAMGYSVTVSAAQQLMTELYRQLLGEQPLHNALRRGRLALYNDKERRAGFDQRIQLEDWLLPVAYQNHPVRVQVAPFPTPEAEAAHYHQLDARYTAPTPTYGFWGRDVDILEIEKRLLGDGGAVNILLVQGMGGAGKTTLLKHLLTWWQTTRLVDQVIYFGYDEKGYNLPQILHGVARQVYGETAYAREISPFDDRVKAQKLTAKLRAERHLLALDNLESVTGAGLSIQHTLDEGDRMALADWLATLAGGRTLVLLGSRGPEEWLVGRFPQSATYELPGLDPEAAGNMVEAVLQRHGVAHYRSHPDHRDALRQLLKLLDGYPLALEIVLANLTRQEPRALLDAFSGGAASIDAATSGELWQDKTASLLRCVEYSHSNLSPDAQALLACLAPFTGVLNANLLPRYAAQLKEQPALAHLPYDRWGKVLQEAVNWGLLTTHEMVGSYLRLQPILPFFLRQRLNDPAATAQQEAVMAAFRAYYDMVVGGALVGLIKSNGPQERQLGQMLINLEYENLRTALKSALENQLPFFQLFDVLFEYHKQRQEPMMGIEICNIVLKYQSSYPDTFKNDFYLAFEWLATTYLLIKKYSEANVIYQQALDLIDKSPSLPEKYKASVYHNLGRVAQEQRDWETAVHHYNRALQLKIEFNDRYGQAYTHGQLGMAAQEQRDWETAVHHYNRALQLFIEFNDRHNQAKIRHDLGLVAQEQQDWETAVHHYNHALELFIGYNDRYSQAGTHHQLGAVAHEQQDWETAVHHYNRALELFIEHKDRYSQAGTHHQLGTMAYEQRDWETAVHHYNRALQIFIEFKDRHNQAKVHHWLGRVAQEQRDWETAVHHYNRALQRKIEFNDLYGQASTHHQLGLVAEAQRDWETAIEHYLFAIEVYSQTDKQNLDIALDNLAWVWRVTAWEQASIEARLAQVLGVSPAQARQLLSH